MKNTNFRAHFRACFLTKMIQDKSKQLQNINLKNTNIQKWKNALKGIQKSENYVYSINNTTPAEFTIDFSDDDVFLHYLIMWIDGLHDKYLKESTFVELNNKTRFQFSFKKFLTESYIKTDKLIHPDTVNTILGRLNGPTDELPLKVQKLIKLTKYHHTNGDIIMPGSKPKSGVFTGSDPAVHENIIKESINDILGLLAPTVVAKDKTLKSSDYIYACIDQDNSEKHISTSILQGSGIGYGITPEQTVDPGSTMTTAGGYSMVAQSFLAKLNSTNAPTFGGKLYCDMPKAIYTHKGKFLYSTKLKAVTPVAMGQDTFKYEITDYSGTTTYLPVGLSKLEAGRKGLLFSKFLGDNLQMNPIIFKGKHPTQGEVCTFATGDAMGAFQFAFLYKAATDKEPPLIFDTAKSFGSINALYVFNGIPNINLINKKRPHVTTNKNIRIVRRNMRANSKNTGTYNNFVKTHVSGYNENLKKKFYNLQTHSNQRLVTQVAKAIYSNPNNVIDILQRYKKNVLNATNIANAAAKFRRKEGRHKYKDALRRNRNNGHESDSSPGSNSNTN